MDFGISMTTSATSWQVVKRAEQLGFTHAWFYDSQLLCGDIFVGMGAAAVNTSKIKLCTGVLVPSNRIAPVAACGLATLNQMAPGRVEFGIGTGFTARRMMGTGAVTRKDLKEYIRVVQTMLGGKITDLEFEGTRRKIGFVNPELGLINIDDPIPLHISAFGPKMRKMTAELNAGWINFVSAVPGAQTDITTMNETRKAAGLDPAACKTMGLTLGCVLRNGEAYDSPRAKAQAGPAVAMIIHNMVEMSERGDLGITTDNDFGEAVAAYRRFYDSYEPKDARYLALHSGHLLFLKPEEEPLITGDMIRDLTFTATAPELRERIRALQDMGYTQFTVQVVEGQEDALDDWAGVIEGL